MRKGKLRTPAHVLLAYLMGAGALAGLASGWLVGPPMQAVGWIGEFFLTCLKMVIVPLVMASMIVGIGGLGDVRKLGRTGGWTLGYYLLTTAVSVAIGIACVLILRPGVGADIAGISVPDKVMGKGAYTVGDFLLNFIWPNVVDAMAQMKLLPVIIFSLVFGAIASTMGARGKLLIDFFGAVNEVIMKMVGLIMWIAPLGVFSLIAARIGQAGGGEGVRAILQTLGLYSLTVLLGLALHAFVVLPLLLRIGAGRSPLRYAAGVSEALLSAFSTASSAATLPITLRTLKENNKVREEAADFVLPLGATVNMDGTALYEAVAAIFIAQAWGIHLTGLQLVLVLLTATLASIGAAAIPEAGLVTMVIVLHAVDLPLEGIGLILAIDWFLDRCRTTVNVWGDSVGAAVIERRAMSPRST